MNERMLAKELEFIRRNPRVSIFWITETKARADRVQHLQDTGQVVRLMDHPFDSYPWCVFEVVERKDD
jgi:hypothetical protein